MRDFAPVTKGLILVNVLVFGLMVWQTGTSNFTVPELIRYGANNHDLIFINHETYRLFTSTFMHANFIHLASNMIALWTLGRLLETTYGSLPMLGIYMLSGLGGSWLSAYMSNTVSVGASGAIFGVMGAIVILAMFGNRFGGAVFQSVLSMLVLNLVSTFTTPNIDIDGHLGGGLTGMALALLLSLFLR